MTIEELKESFKYAFDMRAESMKEANEVVDLYHNIHYNGEQLQTLSDRGQPAETFNIIKLYARQLVGYYASVITSVTAVPDTPDDIPGSALLNDIVKHNDEISNWKVDSNEVKLYGLLTGMMCVHVRPRPVLDMEGNPKKDKFGRDIIFIDKSYVPWDEVLPDPDAKEKDYSDARFTHRYEWISEQKLIRTYGASRAAIRKLKAQESSNLVFQTTEKFNGVYKNYNEYLVIHSIVTNNKGETYSIRWSGDIIISKVKLNRKANREYKIVKVQTDGKKWYGIFREVVEAQKAIDQAIIQLQLLVNTNRVFYTEGALGNKDEIKEFVKAYNRVNGLIKVKNLNGVKIEKFTAEIREQYMIIDRAIDRVQRTLGINDSFLGTAFASDSGRKVSMQRGATIMGLNYLTDTITLLYKLVGEEEFRLILELYRASHSIMLNDIPGGRWIEINKPLVSSKNNKPYYMLNHKGEKEILHTPETDIQTISCRFQTKTVSRHAEDEKNQQMIETVLGGNAGQFLMNVSPAEYAEAVAESVEFTKTSSAPKIAKMFRDAANKLREQNNPQGVYGNTQLGGQPSNSQQVKQVTEEGGSNA